MSKRLTVIALPVIVLFFTFVSFAQTNVSYEELPNFHQVGPTLYRGAQPREMGLQRLKQLGIKTIINLRDDDQRADYEKKEALDEGLSYFNIPLSNFGRPSDDSVDHVLALINAPENQPVFVHCERGSDRTGTIIAVYRIEHDGWSSKQAKAEAKHFGLGFWQVSMKHYIEERYKRRAQPSASTHQSPSSTGSSRP